MQENQLQDLRQRLRELDIKIIDLAELLNISRPTIYALIEKYQNGEREKINADYIALFDYITKNPYIAKNNVMTYIVQNIIRFKSPEDSNTLHEMIKNLFTTPNVLKEEFIEIVVKESRFDSVIEYLVTCDRLLRKEILTTEDKEILKPLESLYTALGKDFNF